MNLPGAPKRVEHVRCGEAVNESERRAIEQIKSHLIGNDTPGPWLLLTNLSFSQSHHVQSDEIDIIVVGPPGVRVIEVKHWTAQYLLDNARLVEEEAEKVTRKARKIGTTLKKYDESMPWVDATILLTQPASKLKGLNEEKIRGVTICGLNQWKLVVGLDRPNVLTSNQINAICRKLYPKSGDAMDGSLRRFAGYVNLELQLPNVGRLHRVFKGNHPTRRDRVVLHLYDLSASDDANAKVKAKRESEAIRLLQQYRWAPRMLDPWQEVPGYAGEMCFFTVVDPAAPSIEERAVDKNWDSGARLAFCRDAVRILKDMHQAGDENELLVHRNLSPKTILVRHDNKPILTGFDRTRIPSDVSVASDSLDLSRYPDTVAPEVRSNGLRAADQRSDVYSLCASLNTLFVEHGDKASVGARSALALGMLEVAQDRCNLGDLDEFLSELLGDSTPNTPVPPARFWTEDQIIRFHKADYRIMGKLGSGGTGTSFKVVEVDGKTGEDTGTFVAKVVHDGETGRNAVKAHSLVRSHSGNHESLATVFAVAEEWQENEIVALLGWIDGSELGEMTGSVSHIWEDWGEDSAEALAVRWLQTLCSAVGVLHANGLTHGDISPRNIIVSGQTVVLTDYDFVSKVDHPVRQPGTLNYCSPERQKRQVASPKDDLFALAASLFHVLVDREPFRYNGDLAKERGLNWEGGDKSDYSNLASVLDQATNFDATKRFSSAQEMRSALDRIKTKITPSLIDNHQDGSGTKDPKVNDKEAIDVRPPASGDESPAPVLREQRVEWLKSMLQSYPGSRWGNSETRGLDSDFASATYVETLLEKTLVEDIQEQRVRLVVLCGNAGDGKTAMLQHIALKLGLRPSQSTNRIIKGLLPNGLRVWMNLDGSAAWGEKSADVLLDEFLLPFQDGPPSDNIVHFLAVNDGRLLEWIDGVEDRLHRETPLTRELLALLHNKAASQTHIRFISLNQRSLVGGITSDGTRIDTSFLEQLLDHLYGAERAREIWLPCQTCSAMNRCQVFRATQIFGPKSVPSSVSNDVRERSRQRLFEALQAVHLRGEAHITVRELRAALVYIVAGVDFCDDYHEDALLDGSMLPYWDRTFAVNSILRQGEVLRELTHFDPALESHPQIDRYLLSQPLFDGTRSVPRYGLPLDSARRRAFFEWTEDDLKHVVPDIEHASEALGLARGSHIRLFRQLPLNLESNDLAQITRRLCAGISRLEDLPPQALDRQGMVPLRITPRTPTETAFWVEKPLENFRVEAVLPPEAEGIERLHRQVLLIYQYRDGNEEVLQLGADLFHLLLELADGYQLGDVSTDDTFANLSIFVRRLVREDERKLLAWNPMQDEQIYQVAAVIRDTSEGLKQQLEIQPVPEAEIL